MQAERMEQQRVESVIGRHVFDQLGCSGTTHTVRVRHLWADHYRVNVFVGEAGAFAQIALSYFVSADGHGRILESTPAIRKHY